jgi:2,3-bisphosphoglycerate-dependent phosphoglycerate mutase
MLLYLVRHGETILNAEKRIQGQVDAPLSDVGYRQSHAAADALATVPVDAIFASPLRRALETAGCIADRHDVPIQTDPRLMELNAGVFEGRLRSDLEVDYPTELARWLGDDDDFVIPSGESRRQLADRGCEAIRAISAMGYRHAVIVAHGGLFSAMLRVLLNATERLTPFSLRNGSITRLTTNGNGQFSIVSFNDVEHLRSVGPVPGDTF